MQQLATKHAMTCNPVQSGMKGKERLTSPTTTLSSTPTGRNPTPPHAPQGARASKQAPVMQAGHLHPAPPRSKREGAPTTSPGARAPHGTHTHTGRHHSHHTLLLHAATTAAHRLPPAPAPAPTLQKQKPPVADYQPEPSGWPALSRALLLLPHCCC